MFTPQVTQLLEEEAPVSGTDYSNRTALHFAASEGHEEIVILLLKHGATVNAYGSSTHHFLLPSFSFFKNDDTKLTIDTDRWNDTPTSVAAVAGHDNIVQILRERGGQAQLPADGLTAKLCAAAGAGHLSKVKRLLHGGLTDVNRGNLNTSIEIFSFSNLFLFLFVYGQGIMTVEHHCIWLQVKGIWMCWSICWRLVQNLMWRIGGEILH